MDLMSQQTTHPASGSGLVYRAIMAVDIQGYSTRDPREQLRAQRELQEVLDRAAHTVGLDRADWQQQTSGDGELAILPEGVDVPTVAGDYPIALAARLAEINAAGVADGNCRLRVRLALHYGMLRAGPLGPVGDAPLVVQRLLDAAPLRRVLDTRDLAYVISDSLYEEVVQPGRCSLRPAEFYPITVAAKGLQYRGHLLTRQVTEARRRIGIHAPFEELIEQSSLGTPTARYIRTLATPEQVAAIRARLQDRQQAQRTTVGLPREDAPASPAQPAKPPQSPPPHARETPDHSGNEHDAAAPRTGATLAAAAAPAASVYRGGFWEALTHAERAALRDVARARAYRHKERLCYQGDESNHIMIIQKGWTKVTSPTEDGFDVILAVRGPGDLIGEIALLGGRHRSATVTALGPVQALVVSAAAFTEFMDTQPRVWRLLSDTFTRRLDDADRRLQANVSAKGRQRLALLLAELAEMSARHEPPGPDGSIEIAPPLSQEELGAWMDASRETVARALSNLRRRGLIRTGWRRITVTDLARLRKYATQG